MSDQTRREVQAMIVDREQRIAEMDGILTFIYNNLKSVRGLETQAYEFYEEYALALRGQIKVLETVLERTADD